MAAPAAPVNRTINIYINQEAAQRSMDALNLKAEKLQSSIKKGEAAGKDMSRQIEQLGKTRTKISELENVISGKFAPSLNMARRQASELWRELEHMSSSAPGYAQKLQEFQKVTASLKQMQVEVRGTGEAMERAFGQKQSLWQQIKGFAASTIIGNLAMSIPAAVYQWGQSMIQGNARLSDSLADVKKATGLTVEEVRALNSELGKIDTRTKASELREIAVGLGQIGEAASKENVENIDKIVVALGDEFGGGAREITTVLGILRNNLNDLKTENYGDDVLHIANALNVLGAEGLATAPVVVEFATRMSGVMQTFGVSSGQILGLSAAMQEMGIEAERGSTAMVKLLQKMAAEKDKFAKVVQFAGGDVKEFKKLINTDIIAAFQKFAESAKKAGSSNSSFAAILKEVKADGSGAGEVLSKMAQNAELVRGKIDLATQSLLDSASVTEEFNTKNTNFAAKWEKGWKRVHAALAQSTFIRVLSNFMLWLVQLAGRLPEVFSFVQKNIVAFGLWSAAVLVNTNAFTGLVSWLGKMITGVRGLTLAQVAHTVAQKADIIATISLSLVKALLAGNIAKVRQEYNLLKLAIGTSPLGILLLALGAAVVLFNSLKEKHEQLSASRMRLLAVEKEAYTHASKELAHLELLKQKVTNLTLSLSQEERIKAAKELQALYPSIFGNLTQEEILAGKVADAYDRATKAIMAKARSQAYESQLEKTVVDLDAAKKSLDEMIQNSGFKVTIDAQGFYEANKNFVAEQKGMWSMLNLNIANYNERLKESKEITDNIVKAQQEGAAAIPDASPNLPPFEPATKKAKDLTHELQRLWEEILKINRDVIAASKQAEEAELLQLQEKYIQLRSKVDSLKAEAANKYKEIPALIKEAFKNISLSLDINEQKDLADLFNKQNEARIKKSYDEQKKALEQHLTEQKAVLDSYYAQGSITHQEYQAAIKYNEQEGFEARKSLAENYTRLLADAEKDLQAARTEEAKKGAEDRTLSDRLLVQKQTDRLRANVLTARKGSRAELNARIEEIKFYYEQERIAAGENAEAIALIDAEQNEAIAEARRNFFNQKIQDWGAVLLKGLEGLQLFLDDATRREREALDKERAMNDERKRSWQEMLDNKRITKAQFDKYVAKADEELRRKEHEAKVKEFRRNKTAQLANAAINLAMTVSGIWANWGAMPAVAAALAIVGAAVQAVQLGMIAKQQPPAYSKGRRPTGDGGMANGPDHEQGGIKMINSITGEVVGEMEGDEAIISKKAVENNPELANALLDSSMYHGGKRVEWFYSMPAPINYQRAASALRSSYYRSGGTVAESTAAYHSSAATASPAYDPEMKELMRRMLEKTDEPIKAYVSWTDIRKKSEEYERLKQGGSLAG